MRFISNRWHKQKNINLQTTLPSVQPIITISQPTMSPVSLLAKDYYIILCCVLNVNISSPECKSEKSCKNVNKNLWLCYATENPNTNKTSEMLSSGFSIILYCTYMFHKDEFELKDCGLRLKKSLWRISNASGSQSLIRSKFGFMKCRLCASVLNSQWSNGFSLKLCILITSLEGKMVDFIKQKWSNPARVSMHKWIEEILTCSKFFAGSLGCEIRRDEYEDRGDASHFLSGVLPFYL